MNKVKLGEVLDVKRGASLSGDYYSESGEKIRLTLGNFDYPNGGFKENTSKSDIYFTGEVKPEFILKKGDIITPLTEQVAGLLGETARIPEDDLYIQSGDVGLVIPNESKLDNKYAYYLLSSPLIKRQLGAAAQQTKIRHTSPDKIKDCEAWLPSLEYQKKAGELLDFINNKIKNNNKINAELESMAKTIYDYWFLQFEFPNEDGKPYKSSGGKMVWNEELKREIPEGWEVSDLSKLCDFNNGINYDKEELGDKDYKIVNVRNISSTTLLLDKSDLDTICLKSNQADKYLVENDDILIARSGTPGAVRLLESDVNDIIYCGFIIRCKPKNKEQRYYLTYSLKLLEGSNATKTGGSILQNVSQETLKQISVCIPPNEIVEKYNESINDILRKMQNVIEENRELTSLRDFLIPMLMNGQVGFKNK